MRPDRTLTTLALAALLLGATAAVRPPTHRAEENLAFARKLRVRGMDLVAGGDSRALMDVAPEAMAGALPGWRIWNQGFASCGLATPGYLDHLESCLDPASPRRAVLLCVTAWSLTPAAQGTNSFSDWSRRPPSEIRQLAALGAVSGRLTSVWQAPGDRVTKSREGGWFSIRFDPPQPELTLPRYADLNFRGGNVVDRAVLGHVADRVRRWAASGVRTFAVVPPATSAIRDAETRLGAFDASRIRAELESAGAVWIDVPGEFVLADGSHLQDEDALSWSRAVAERIAAAGR